MTAPYKCKDCFWFAPVSNPAGDGHCHREPPVAGAYPPVKGPVDWCSKFLDDKEATANLATAKAGASAV